MAGKDRDSIVTESQPDPALPEVNARGRGHGPLERVTVNLTPRASRALTEAARTTGDTKTDTINRALQLYAMVNEVLEAGGSLYVRSAPKAELERLMMF